MLLQEQADAAKRNVPVQVFATDIDADAIERARAGVYPDSISADVSPERLARFFAQDGDTYRVAKTRARLLVFAKQDVTKDPPFSQGRPHQLPQPAHLHGRRPAAEAHAALPLRAQPGRLPVPRQLRDRRRRRRPLRPGRQEVEALPAPRARSRRSGSCRPRRCRCPAPPRARPAPGAPSRAHARARARPGREDAAREARPGLRGRQRRGRRALHPRPHRPLPRAAAPASPAAASSRWPARDCGSSSPPACARPWRRRRRCATSACACRPTATRRS